MTLFHHDGRYYNVAVSETADKVRAKFSAMIEAGRVNAHGFFDRLQREVPEDYVIDTGNLKFDIREERIQISTNDHRWPLHPNGLSQTIAKTNILNGGVAEKMMLAQNDKGKWGRELLLHNLRTMYGNGERERVLVRVVNGEARALLSDRYRRMDNRVILDTFARKANLYGAVPIETDPRKFRSSYYHDTKVGFSMFLSDVFEPVAGEVLIIGIIVESSDFGCGALTVRLIIMRVLCTNLAITQDEIRKVHLGARLPDNIQFSQKTYELDTQTMASAVEDTVDALLGPEAVHKRMDAIKAMAEREINVRDVFGRLRTQGHLLKAEVEKIEKVFNEPDVRLMPPGNSLWRASNAISLFANRIDDDGEGGRAVELRYVAGMLIDNTIKEIAA